MFALAVIGLGVIALAELYRMLAPARPIALAGFLALAALVLAALLGDQFQMVLVLAASVAATFVLAITRPQRRNVTLARADSVPNLEILTGEVAGAGHASASGRLDDEHIFYLQARGIPFEDARRLVIRGFFAQLLEKIEVPELRERVLARVEAELEK